LKLTKKKLWLLLGLLVPLGLVWVYAALFLKFVKVPTGSMMNTILPGDHLVVDRRTREIQRGDVITFKYPNEPSTQFISRVIGLPEESIQIVAGRVSINDRELPEQHVSVEGVEDPESIAPLREISTTGNGDYRVYEYSREPEQSDFFSFADFAKEEPFEIPHGEYFVMGDHRDNSSDSRIWGTVKREAITGKALFVYWSSTPEGAHPGRMFTKIK
jgi:signal peptidase I